MKNTHRILFIFCICLLLFCTKDKNPTQSDHGITFAIYISSFIPDMNNPVVPPVNDLNLIPEPFLTNQDITTYNWSTHHIKYSKSVHDRLIAWGDLMHRIFVVVTDGERIYWGKFVSDVDSFICRNPVIKLLPPHPNGGNIFPESIVIEPAYPQQFGSDPDIRNDNRIFNALVNAGLVAR